jgi:hypothetical protein
MSPRQEGEVTHAKTDCQGEDPIMILIERLRPVGDPINASEALKLEAAEAIQTQALALDMQGEELSSRIEDHKVKDAAIASLQGEVERHAQDKRDAYEAVKEALSLCQHTPAEWLAMSPELAAFKREVFGVLEMRCLNLGYGVRAALSQHPGEGEKA